MPPSKNRYVTLWHAANAGDVQYLRQRMREVLTNGTNPKDLEQYKLDLEALEVRLFRSLFPKALQEQSPELQGLESELEPIVFETENLRLVIETLSGRSVAGHGYLTDLSLERKFGELVLESYGAPGVTKVPTNETVRLFGKDRTLTYACTSDLHNELFVGVIAFSDFATFNVEGYLLGNEEQELHEVLESAMLKILKTVEPG